MVRLTHVCNKIDWIVDLTLMSLHKASSLVLNYGTVNKTISRKSST